jgi:hypothetical protein
MTRTIRDVRRAIEADGIVVEAVDRLRKHYRIVVRQGDRTGHVIVAATPSDRSNTAVSLATARRLLRTGRAR